MPWPAPHDRAQLDGLGQDASVEGGQHAGGVQGDLGRAAGRGEARERALELGLARERLVERVLADHAAPAQGARALELGGVELQPRPRGRDVGLGPGQRGLRVAVVEPRDRLALAHRSAGPHGRVQLQHPPAALGGELHAALGAHEAFARDRHRADVTAQLGHLDGRHRALDGGRGDLRLQRAERAEAQKARDQDRDRDERPQDVGEQGAAWGHGGRSVLGEPIAAGPERTRRGGSKESELA